MRSAKTNFRASVAAALAAIGWAVAPASAFAQDAAAPPSPTAGTEQLPYDPECLAITQSSAATYMIENTACATQSVLASIELAGDGTTARCFVKKIRSQISIASERIAPVINYQCLEGTAGCTLEELRSMFPECRAG